MSRDGMRISWHWAGAMANLSNNPGISVAWAQFLFNPGMTIVGLELIRVLRDRLSNVP